MKPSEIPPPAGDAIVDEVRAIRAEIFEQSGNDVARFCEHLREMEAQYKGRVIDRNKARAKNPSHTASGTQS